MATPATQTMMISSNGRERSYQGSTTIAYGDGHMSVQNAKREEVDTFTYAKKVSISGSAASDEIVIRSDHNTWLKSSTLSAWFKNLSIGAKSYLIRTGGTNKAGDHDKIVIEHLRVKDDFEIDVGAGSREIQIGEFDTAAAFTLHFRGEAPLVTIGSKGRQLDLSEYSGKGKQTLNIQNCFASNINVSRAK